MRCPFCHAADSRVLDSRQTEDGAVVRRRRVCDNCHRRFTTYERVEGVLLSVAKKDGRIEPFESNKIRRGVQIACEKRPVTEEQIDELVVAVENKLRDAGKTEVTSQEIGRLVMEELRKLDAVAYVRFASVYHEFSSPERFIDTVAQLATQQPPLAASPATKRRKRRVRKPAEPETDRKLF